MPERIIRKPPSAERHNEEISLKEVVDWLKEYGTFLGIGAGIVLVLVFSVIGYNYNRRQAVSDASQMLSSASSPEQLRNIVAQYPKAPAAPLALLALASDRYHAGDFDAALAAYGEFMDNYPDHPMLLVAEFGRIECMSARGATPEVLTLYSRFIEAHPDHYLIDQAILGKAECLQRMNRLQDAKIAYEDFIAAFPDNPWTSVAQSALMLLERQIRMQEKQQRSAQADAQG